MTTYTIAADIKAEIASRVVEQAAPGYAAEYMGQWYAVDTDRDGVLDSVVHAESARQWNPWHDAAVAVPVIDCIDSDGADFDPTPEDGYSAEEAFEIAAAFAADYVLETVEVEA